MIAGAVSKLSPSGTRSRTPSRIPVLWSSYQPAGTAKAGLKNGHSWPLQTVITFSTSAGAGDDAARPARKTAPAERRSAKAQIIEQIREAWAGTLPAPCFATVSQVFRRGAVRGR